MTKQNLLLETVKQKYSDFSSFAVWDNELNNLNVFEKKKKLLHTNSVIVGLNISEKVKPLENFHATRFDQRLKNLFTGTKGEGCYMTDLIKVITPNAKKAKLYADDDAKKKFEKEMKTLGIGDEATFLVLGNDAWKIFVEWFPKKFTKKKKLIHPSHHFISDKKWHAHNRKII